MNWIIRHRKVAIDDWQFLPGEADAAPLPKIGTRVVLPLSRWVALDPRAATPGHVGVWLDSHEEPEPLLARLPDISLLAIRFPVFTDGRGYSLARLLRQRHGYTGELRAFGDVLQDQLSYLTRCGFDSFALRPDQDLHAALTALDEISVAYQETINQRHGANRA